MKRDDFRSELIALCENIIPRTFLVDAQTRIIAEATRNVVRDDDAVLMKLHDEFEKVFQQRKVTMSYTDHCPDCVVLPTAFPTSCLTPLLAALRGQIDDPKCVVHCGYTVVGFGLGLWIGDHPHPIGSVGAGKADFAAAADALEAAYGEGVKNAGAIPWGLILSAVFALIQQLLKDVVK